MKLRTLAILVSSSAIALAQSTTTTLPEVTVYSSRIANQSPTDTFAMPISALRYEPVVDIHARNLAEGQADVTIRGGIFESTGFQVGAVTLLDPQTGHYLAEIPIAPAMLGAPGIATGAELALGALNTTTGAVTYRWREVKDAGAAGVGFGEHQMHREEFYQGFTGGAIGGRQLGADVALAHSASDGAVPFGEHRFDRVSGRVQLRSGTAQTDLFAGYQAKFFGWPNLYTPFNSNETENLETLLIALNHRVDFGRGEFVELGAFHRRNKDDYAFNRFAPLGPVHPFQHTTWIDGVAAHGRRELGGLALNFSAEALADELHSTSLTAGRYHTRTLTKLTLLPEKTWALADGSRVTLKAGATYDDSNRDSAAGSPVVEIARETSTGPVQRVFASYTKTTQLPSYTALNSSATAGLFRGNPNLGRETAHQFELGASGAAGGWTANAAVFWRRDVALVDWTFARGVTARTANPVDIDVGGFEVVARRSWAPVDLVIGYTALTKDADYRGARVDASFYALNYARQRLTAAITWRITSEILLRLDNVARIQAPNFLRTIGGDRAVTSTAALAYRPRAVRGLELSVQVANAWDSDFQEVPAVPATPRQVSAGVVYTW